MDGGIYVLDGDTWSWCPYHKMKDVYDGIYVKHKQKDYNTWVEHKAKNHNLKDIADVKSTSSSSNDHKIGLSDDLKIATVPSF